MNPPLQAIRGVDVSIYYFLSRFAGNWILGRLARLEETNNLLKGGVFFALYWYFWFRPSSDRERRRSVIITTLIGAILAIIAARGIAFTVPFRVRPIFDTTLAHPTFSVPIQFNLVNWSAFPSDTAAYFFALAFGVMYLSRRLAIPIAIYTAVWVCLTRMYIGIHYASDIVVGVAIGITMAWISIKSDLLQAKAARLVRAADTGPHWFYGIAFLFSFEMATVFDGLRSLGNALLHVVMHGLGFESSHLNRPIDAWGGFLVLAAFLATAVYVVSIVRRARHGGLAILRDRVTDFRPTWFGLRRRLDHKDHSTRGLG